MYQKISFKENCDYFSQSIIFSELKQYLSSDKTGVSKTYFINIVDNPEEKINLTIQLCMETILKHNLNGDMFGGTKGIDPVYFLTEDNSQEVFEVKSLVHPPRRDRNAPPPTKDEQEMQRANFNLYHTVVDGVARYMLDKQHLENIDVCQNMKEEFSAFMENKYNSKSTKDIKNKP